MQYYVLCNSCGKGFTYTDEDLNKNASNATMNVLSSVGQIAGSLSGNWGGVVANKMNEKEVKDFSRCPHCFSHDIRHVSREAFQKSQKDADSSLPGNKLSSVAAQPHIEINSNATTESLLKRVELFLEDEEWETATAYCDRILDVDPTNGTAYLYRLMSECRVSQTDDLFDPNIPVSDYPSYKRVIRFGEKEIADKLAASANNRGQFNEDKRKNAFLLDGLIASGENFVNITYAVSPYGTLLCTASESDLPTKQLIPSDRHFNVKAISGMNGAFAILKNDGTVCMDGQNWIDPDARFNLSSWKDIVQVKCGINYILGLKSNGTVCLAYEDGTSKGWVDDVTKWTDIIQIEAKNGTALGLTSKGTVLSCGDSSYGRTNVSSWNDIVMIAIGSNYSFGLKRDGTVVTTEYNGTSNTLGEGNVQSWHDIIQISAAASYNGGYVLGLKRDGGVLATGDDQSGQCAVQSWSDIIWVIAAGRQSFGIRKDGTVCAAGKNENTAKVSSATIHFDHGPCDVKDWKLFESYEHYQEERAEKVPKAQEMIAELKRKEQEKKKLETEARIAQLEQQKIELEETLPTIKGLFSAGKKNKLLEQITQIEKEIEKLRS